MGLHMHPDSVVVTNGQIRDPEITNLEAGGVSWCVEPLLALDLRYISDTVNT